MKTVGEILSERRKGKGLSLEDVEKEIKIRQSFLEAIEKNQFNLISDPATLKGFLRNYAQFLGISPQTIMAIFRRDFEESGSGQIIPRGIIEPPIPSQFSWTPKTTFLAGIILTIFLIVLIVTKIYSGITGTPSLEILSPKEGEVYEKTVLVEIKTDPQATLKIDGNPVSLNEKGQFKEELTFPRGENTLVVESFNRQGKKTTKIIKFFIK